jgi:hypothetical protein
MIQNFACHRLQFRRDPGRGRRARPLGIDLPMAVGAVAMSASTIIVAAANARLLGGLKLRTGEPA